VSLIIIIIIVNSLTNNQFMLQISIIVFREILEIALILGILIAATKSISGRTKWILFGLIAGIFGCSVVAFFTNSISESFDGMGQEIFNGFILIAASLSISWTVLWMQKHSRTISQELKALGKSVKEGKKPLYILSLVVFLSVLREGAEIVLFSYSSYVSGVLASSVFLGLAIGVALGSMVGLALYFGMLKVFGRYFFIITTWMLVFLSAGITAQAIGFWINAEFVPPLINPIWDSSAILSQSSMIGKFLHIFLGYLDRPSGMQMIGYSANLLILITGLQIVKYNFKKTN
jgi:high-affinity iron transporter